MSKTEDFWPNDLLESIPISPRDILQEQAALLGEKTNNIVLAEVSTFTGRINNVNEGEFSHIFSLRVPALSNYRFDLFTIYHSIEMYPVTAKKNNYSLHELVNEEELKSFVSSTLREEQTVKVIRALIAQTRNEDKAPF